MRSLVTEEVIPPPVHETVAMLLFGLSLMELPRMVYSKK